MDPELTVDEIDQALSFATAPPITSPDYIDKLLDQRNATMPVLALGSRGC